jgi:hypothetical protein
VDRWIDAAEPLASFYLSQGVPALFWRARVVRPDGSYLLRGRTPLENDLIVSAPAPAAR